MADNRQSVDSLLPIVYQELRRLAASYLRRERPGQTLQPTALVHEAYLRLLKDRPDRWQNRAHFCAIAAHSMRQILIERARARGALKRGGAQPRVTLDEALVAGGERSFDFIALDQALERLNALDPEQARLVELRFFGGLTIEETAEAMQISPATVKRHWTVARAWLARELEGDFASVSSERWRTINELFHAALELEPAARDAFVRDSAAGDLELQREVESLLASHDRTEGFLDEPAWGVGADLILEDTLSLTGRTLGAYRVMEEIGRGGMGVVYAAEDSRLARHVALKALPAAFTRDPVRRERLKREARAAAALSHPAIATIFALEEIDGDLYIVSELVRGRTLRDELRDGPLPPRLLHETLVDIASALAAAHARGIVHRDLKPENVIRRADGQIKILDFGLARIGLTSSSSTFTRLTEAGIAMGTPGYMAPEQFQGSDVDARADQFAFGILAWELATGEHPFGSDAGSLVARMSDMMDGRTPPGLSRPLAPPGLHRIACRCMRGAPGERYPSTDALLEDLRSIAPDRATVAATPMPTGLWWWQFHQKAVAIVNGLTPVLAWFVRKWAVRPYGAWAFYAVLILATASVTLRLHLLFTSQVHPGMLVRQRARFFRWIAIAEGLLAAVLLASAALLASVRDEVAAVLVSLAIVTFASLGIIEPATTAAAGIDDREPE